MIVWKSDLLDWRNWFDPVGHEQQIRDYIDLLDELVWKRMATFVASVVLGMVYFDPVVSLLLISFVMYSEFLDQRLARKARSWDPRDRVMGRSLLKRITFNTVLSAASISCFLISMAVQQPTGGHFTPLFFLFSASIFAAMYTSQMLGILVLRLAIYGAAFLTIALLDVVRYAPPLLSAAWLEFFSTVLVIYFVADISWQFYQAYQRNLEQMKTIERENERSKAALVIKSQFVSVVSHELRTPLTSIKGSIDLINSGSVGEVPQGVKSLLEIAGRNSQRLAVLIDDLLDLQKMEAGEMSFIFEPLLVSELVSDVVEATAGFAVKLGIEVRTDMDADGAKIMGDRNRLSQALQNLMSNALRFSHEGGTVTVRARNLGGRVRVSVHDNGVGIPEGAEDRVFGKFMQVDSSDRRKVGGTGLGLNITKQIAERHNATIDFESELGVGSIFYLEFDRMDETGQSAAARGPSRVPRDGVYIRRAARTA